MNIRTGVPDRRCRECKVVKGREAFDGERSTVICRECLDLLDALFGGGTKKCPRCGVTKQRADFPRSRGRKDGLYPYCRDCSKKAKRESVAKNPVTPQKRREYRKRYEANHPERKQDYNTRRNLTRYGLTVEDYDGMLERQGGVCAICRRPETATRATGALLPLAVDHCHRTEKVRGLLCSNCNHGIGHFDDTPERMAAAMDYLIRHAAESGVQL